MKLRNILASSALTLGGMLAAAQASAQGYLGFSVGQSDIDDEITAGLITSGTVDGKDTAWKLFGGYLFTPNFGLELAYVDLGEVSYSGSFFASPVTGGKVEVNGFNVAALGSFPVTEQFSLFGKLGLFIWEAKASDTTGGAPFAAKEDGSDLSFGVGIGYHFTRNLGVRAEWERFEAADADADLVSIGLVWRF